MQELEYPFDAGSILSKKKQLRRMLLDKNEKYVHKKIAILGGSTTSDITQVLDLFLLNYGIQASFYESEYNQFYEDAVFDNPKLKSFAPDVIYICTSNRNIEVYPSLKDSGDAITRLMEEEYKKFNEVWDSLRQRYHCPIIQNNFEMPAYRLLGNRDASDPHGRVNYLSRLNMKFYRYAQEHEDFYICDINYISADYGLKEWADSFYYHMYRYALNVNAIPYLAFQVANMIKSLFGKNKKGFVLDLDDTLWGGVVGDDGAENIVLGPEEPEGRAYLEFQKYLREHLQLGVILAIDSKNDMENVLVGLKHPDSVLSKEDFIEIKANWEPKDKNFLEIASDLDLLPESLVFVDDNPAERNIVAGTAAGAAVPKIGEVHQYIQVIDRSGFFETTILSADDAERNDMYRANIKRQRVQVQFSDYGDYLRSLEMKGIIKPFEPAYMARIAQLTNKSNQFNLTTHRYTQIELEMLSKDPAYITLYGKLADKFGDNGVVSALIGHVIEKECRIDLWIMSCRVLKRDMEYAMMDAMVRKCIDKGVEIIRGYYYPTAKNSMVREFYAHMGFKKAAEDEAGNTEWICQVRRSYKNKNNVIRMEE